MSQLTEKEMILKLIECIETMEDARNKYRNYPGGGVAQKNKNRLAKEWGQRIVEANNIAFNIKQLLKQ